MQRLAAIARGVLDEDRLRRHAERLALQAGVGAVDAARCGEAAVLHLIGWIDAAPGDAAAASGLGSRLLGGSSDRTQQLAAMMAAHMAERWDGTGFPRSLVGEAIPLGARIAAVALRFEQAMLDQVGVADGPQVAALAVMAEAGTVLDPILSARLRWLIDAGDAADNIADAMSGSRRRLRLDAISPVLAAAAAP